MIFDVSDIADFKIRAQQWASGFEVCCYLDSNQFTNADSKFDLLIAAGVKAQLTAKAGQAFEALQQFRQQHPDWITGFLSYDLKNETEHLSSNLTDELNFPDLYFFAPLHLIKVKGHQAEIISDESEHIWKQINNEKLQPLKAVNNLALQPCFTQQDYIDTFSQIKQHISRGDIYVTNFCQEFFAANATIDPLNVFWQLNTTSPAPFASFFRHYEQYVLCASPERFLAKRGRQLISQPIKGTAKRGSSTQEDERIKQELRNNPKEQQENVMIVDLVRNDLTKSAEPGTVKTEELFGIYSFTQVHQMISTVTCQLRDGLSPVGALRNTFPMGSMTGAPKLKAMELMDHYERTRRGIYSGAIGYFDPDDDFDFNVVIRTIFYNAHNQYLSFQVGSAITFDAVAEQEYDECLLKAQAIMQVLGLQQ
ncbi:anthranilate synthase component I family protein [Mucilaginibacter sp. CSA2-8R]|uniref:anthranilate synthase component I family protein n=1 Tax=Mucilaginibacter sp. CSA2-8R TaxID=3141542 RepID=UPI00315CAAFA